MTQLTISLAQMDIVLGDPEANLRKAEAWTAEAARRGSQLVVFPEMWTTGFDWANLETLAAQPSTCGSGQVSAGVIARVAALARQSGVWLNGSLLALDEAGRPANTSLLFDPGGQPAGLYRKIHLFGLMDEDRYLAPGQNLVAVETPWGSSGLAVCYDLRFPELFRTYALQGVTMVFLPAEWPHPRLAHWQTLLRARAIENQMYMVGVNRVGDDSSGHFFGHSAIIDPWGNPVIEGGETELLLTATVEMDVVAEVRRKIPVFRDRRPALYRLDEGHR